MPAKKKDLALPVHWSVIEKPHPYGRPERKLRIEVTLQDGTVRVLAPASKLRVSYTTTSIASTPSSLGRKYLSGRTMTRRYTGKQLMTKQQLVEAIVAGSE